MALAQGPTFISRDLVRFIKRPSPVTALLNRLYELLLGTTPLSTSARSSFAHSWVGYEVTLTEAISTDMDEKMKEAFTVRPQIVLLQGTAHPRRVSEPWIPIRNLNAEKASPATISRDDAEDVIFLPFSLHQLILEAVDDRDEEMQATWMMMALIILTYELSHWLFTKNNGYREGKGLLDAGDAGMRSIELLLGYHYKLVSYADGTRDLVKRRLPPPRDSIPPSLPASLLPSLLGFQVPPKIVDISSYPDRRTNELPTWKGDDAMYKITSIMDPSELCHHGDCRIGGRQTPRGSRVGLPS